MKLWTEKSHTGDVTHAAEGHARHVVFTATFYSDTASICYIQDGTNEVWRTMLEAGKPFHVTFNGGAMRSSPGNYIRAYVETGTTKYVALTGGSYGSSEGTV